MNAVEEHQIKRKVVNLELRVAKLEGMLLRAGVQIGETEHGEAVFSVAPKVGGPGASNRMASALLGTNE